MIKWGIIGTGRIAATFIKALSAGHSGRALVVAGRDPERTRRFAFDNGVPEFTVNTDKVFTDSRVDAVYIATPHTSHAELSIAALNEGKPVLCEKPMAVDCNSLANVLDTAKRSGTLFIEGYMYRHHPQTAKLRELLRAGVIGEINFIESAMGFASEYKPNDRLFDPKLAGGAIWDIGGYPLSMAMLVAEAALGVNSGEVDCFAAGGVTAYENIDISACAVVGWRNRIVAQIACSCGATLSSALRIHGASGRIVVPNPWVCDRTNPEEGLIIIERESGIEEIRVPAAQTSFGYEADGFARLLENNLPESAAPITNTESFHINQLLCRWREKATSN